MISVTNSIVEELLSAPAGAVVRGTFDTDAAVGSFVALDTGHTTKFVHAAVARVDGEDHGLPLAVTRVGGHVVVVDRRGHQLPLNVITSDMYYARNPSNAEIVAALCGTKVMIVGQGSVGSALTIALARARVGHIAGNDPDHLEAHNCMRHSLTTEFIGWNKAHAMHYWLKTACPACDFIPIGEDLFSGNRQSLRRFLDEFDPDAVVAVTDGNGPNMLAQIAAIYAGATYFAVGCFNNAIEGELFIRLAHAPLPPDDPVGYACYEELHPPRASESLASQYDYSVAVPGRYAGEPALAHLINHKVCIAASIMIDTLLYNGSIDTPSIAATRRHLSQGAQYVRIGGPCLTEGVKALKLHEPWQVKWSRLKRHADCGICGDGADACSVLFPETNMAVKVDEDWR